MALCKCVRRVPTFTGKGTHGDIIFGWVRSTRGFESEGPGFVAGCSWMRENVWELVRRWDYELRVLIVMWFSYISTFHARISVHYLELDRLATSLLT